MRYDTDSTMAPIQGKQSRNSSPFPTFLLSSSTIINTLARPTLPAHVPGILIARRFPRIPRYPAPVKRPLKVYLPFKFLLIPQLQSARLSVPITPEIGGGGEKREERGKVGETTLLTEVLLDLCTLARILASLPVFVRGSSASTRFYDFSRKAVVSIGGEKSERILACSNDRSWTRLFFSSYFTEVYTEIFLENDAF